MFDVRKKTNTATDCVDKMESNFYYSRWNVAHIVQWLLLIVTASGMLQRLYSSSYCLLQQVTCCTECTVAITVCYSWWHDAQIAQELLIFLKQVTCCTNCTVAANV